MGSWDQQLLANSFNTMALVPPVVTDWVADFGASNHTTSDAGHFTSVRPLILTILHPSLWGTDPLSQLPQ
jgi:hypothetical protein